MSINGTRWKIGWSPKLVIISLLIVGIIVGAMAGDGGTAGQLGIVSLIAGIAVWLWGRAEVNSKYTALLEDFRDRSRKQVERETGGMEVSSAHSFISARGSSPMLIEPARTYSTSHLLFGDTSVVVNRQYKYDMKERTQKKGGSQQEVFYDQISNVQSQDYNNYAELEISLSSGDTERIRGRDTAGINRVKSDLQTKMRDARRGLRRSQEPRAPAGGQPDAGGAGRRRGQPEASGARGGARDAGAARDAAAADGRAQGASGSGTAESSAQSSTSDSVSTDWLAGGSSETTLRVQNDAGASKSVRVGCRVDGEKRLADDVRLDPGEAADWDDLPDSRFEVGVVVDGGPSAGQRFDPGSTDEIAVSITDSDVVFGDGAGPSASSGGGSGAPAGGGSSASAGGGVAGGNAAASESTSGAGGGTADGSASAGSTGSAGPSDESSSTDDGGSGGVMGASSAASRVFGGSDADESDADGSGDAGPADDESWDNAAELAAAVQDATSRERTEDLATFLDASSPSERRAAVRGLRQSVRDHPEPVIASVSSVAALLDDDAGETRQEAIVTLQRLAEMRPDVVGDVTDAVVERLDDDNPKVRTAACRTLDEVGANVGAEKLAELADGDSHKGVQVAAHRALQSVRN